jgi:hypothetical protein
MRNEYLEAFLPGSTVSLAVSTSTANVALPNAEGKVKQQLRIFNASDAIVFVKVGITGVTAAVTDMPIPIGGVEIITLDPTQLGPLYLAGIRASGTGTIYATVGVGY